MNKILNQNAGNSTVCDFQVNMSCCVSSEWLLAVIVQCFLAFISTVAIALLNPVSSITSFSTPEGIILYNEYAIREIILV